MFWFGFFIFFMVLAIFAFFRMKHYDNVWGKAEQKFQEYNHIYQNIPYEKRTEDVRKEYNSLKKSLADAEKDCRFGGRGYNWGNSLVGFSVTSFVFLVITLIGGAVFYTSQFDLRSDTALLPIKTEQKQELIKQIKSELSNEQYTQLISAMPNDTSGASDTVVAIFKDSAVSDFLIERATRIVELNGQIYDLQNSITSQKIDICNSIDNVFIPRIPGVGPSCTFDFSKEI